MPKEYVSALITKAAQDPVFLNGLTRKIDKTVSDHSLDLPPQQADALKTVNWNKTFGPMMSGKWVVLFIGNPSEDSW